MPLYHYKHPRTNEVFEEFRQVNNRNKKFIAPDGVKCERIYYNYNEIDIRKNIRKNIRTSRAGEKLEVFQADPLYVKKCRPKTIKFRDGHVERYDPTKHC